MQKLAVFLSCCFFSALLCVPSFAVSDPAPLDSSYVVQDDVSLLSATPISISPLSTSTPTYWSSSDISGLLRDVSSIKNDISSCEGYLQSINFDVDSISTNVRDIELYLPTINSNIVGQYGFLQDVLGTTGQSSSFPDFSIYRNLNFLRGYTQSIAGDVDSLVSFFSSGLNVDFSTLPITSGFKIRTWDFSQVGIPLNDFEVSFSDYLYRSSSNLSNIARSTAAYYLGLDGKFYDAQGFYLADIVNLGFMGISTVLRGDSGSNLSGSLLNSSDLSSTSYSSNNILGAFKPLFTIQNDLARLTHVVADPTEQALHDATKDNVQSVTDNLTGEKGVTSQDIGDLSGISSGVGDFMTTGVSADRLTGSISDEGNYSFFSQQTADDLHTFPAPQSADDDFIDFYAINRQEYSSLLGGDSDG